MSRADRGGPQGLLEMLQAQLTEQGNLLHAFGQEDLGDAALKGCKAAIKALKGMKAKAEKTLTEVVRSRWREKVEHISSIPGVGVMSACKPLKTAYALVIKRQKYEADYETKILQKAS